jgi:hypothetical protein
MEQKRLRAIDNLVFENEKTGANIEIPFGTEVALVEGTAGVGVNVETGQHTEYVHIVYDGVTIKAPRTWFDGAH